METLARNIELEATSEMAYTSVYKLTANMLGDMSLGEDAEGRMASIFTDALSRWADARQTLVRANQEEQRNAQRMIDGIKAHSSYGWHMDSRRVNEAIVECAKYEEMLNNLRYIIGIERETMVAIFRKASEATFTEKN